MNSVFDAKTLPVFDRNGGEKDRRGKKVEKKTTTKYEKRDSKWEESHSATEHTKALCKITSETVDICSGAHYCSNTIE